MLAHGLVDRPTQDVDMFTPDGDLAALTDALVAALHREGMSLVVEARTPTYVRLTVTEQAGRACKIELARDARIRPPVRLDVGAVLHLEEIAADKVLALYGRAAARDFVDVAALLRRFPEERLLALAAEKDPGFDAGHFSGALRSVVRLTDEDFTVLGLSIAEVAMLRDEVARWAHALEGPGGGS